MRRILVERARHQRSLKADGNYRRQDMPEIVAAEPELKIDLLALNEALEKLEREDQCKTSQAAILCRSDDCRSRVGTRYCDVNCG